MWSNFSVLQENLHIYMFAGSASGQARQNVSLTALFSPASLIVHLQSVRRFSKNTSLIFVFFSCLPSFFRCFGSGHHQPRQRPVWAEPGAAQRVRRRGKVWRERTQSQVNSRQRCGYGRSEGWGGGCVCSGVCCLWLQRF